MRQVGHLPRIIAWCTVKKTLNSLSCYNTSRYTSVFDAYLFVLPVDRVARIVGFPRHSAVFPSRHLLELYCVRNVVSHEDAREGKWRGNCRMDWVASTLTLPRNVVYPALLTLMPTSRLPAVDSTDSPAYLNGLVRLGERGNVVSARVPSGSTRALHPTTCPLITFITLLRGIRNGPQRWRCYKFVICFIDWLVAFRSGTIKFTLRRETDFSSFSTITCYPDCLSQCEDVHSIFVWLERRKFSYCFLADVTYAVHK